MRKARNSCPRYLAMFFNISDEREATVSTYYFLRSTEGVKKTWIELLDTRSNLIESEGFFTVHLGEFSRAKSAAFFVRQCESDC